MKTPENGPELKAPMVPYKVANTMKINCFIEIQSSYILLRGTARCSKCRCERLATTSRPQEPGGIVRQLDPDTSLSWCALDNRRGCGTDRWGITNRRDLEPATESAISVETRAQQRHSPPPSRSERSKSAVQSVPNTFEDRIGRVRAAVFALKGIAVIRVLRIVSQRREQAAAVPVYPCMFC